ncbi:MAG TPA: PAS domain S-box protein [Anaerolineaceae bacterium]|nr:PAS domain S-box protein [Anaerolineaceae bacterium]
MPNFLPGLHLFIVRDITARKKAEETLRQSEFWLNSLIENTDDFIWSVDPEFNAVTFNQSTIRGMELAGLSPMVKGQSVIDARLPHEIQLVWKNAYQRALEGERFTLTLPGISHRLQWVEYTFNPVLTANGTCLGVSVFGHDISERARMIQSLRESEARYLTLVQNLPGTMVVLFDTSLNIVLAEGQIIRQLGMKPERLVGNNIALASMTGLSDIKEACQKALNGELARFEMSKGEFHILALVVPVLDSNNRIISGLLMLQDITLLKQAQWQLKNERDILQRYLDVAGVMLGVLDMSGVIRMINRKGCQILEYHLIEDVIGKNWAEICALPEGVTTPQDLINHPDKAWYTRYEYVEILVHTLSGKDRLIAFHNALLKDENKSPTGILFSGEDITERRSAEENLQNQYQLSQFLSKATDIKEILDICLQTAIRVSGMDSGGIYLIDKTGALRLIAYTNLSEEFVSEYCCIEPGSPREQFVMDGKPKYIEASQIVFFQFPPHEMFQSLAVIPVMHQGQISACINVASKTHPTIQPNAPRALESIAAQIGGVISRSLAEEALRESEQQLENFFSVNLDLLCIANFQGYFIKLNRYWENILGFSIDELLATPYIHLIHPDDRESTLTEQSRLKEGIETLSFINRYICKDGSYRFFEWKAHPQGDYIYAAARDITERLQMEKALENERNLLSLRVAERTAELQALNVELARASRAKDAFVASMNHELRTPLTGILGLTEALQGEVYGPLTEKQKRSLHTIEESGTHLLNLINDILDLSRIEASRLELEYSLVPVRQVCDASIRFIAETARKKNITIHTHYSPDVIAVWADERRLRQMLINLLSNAVKFTPEGGSIGLDVTGDGENKAISLAVWDTGIGIKEMDVPRLFKPFVQLDSSLARQYSGTGLGLTLVLHMTQMHHGCISLQSESGQGSRFAIILPWKKEAQVIQQDTEQQQHPVLKSRYPGEKILVIDDNETTANHLCQILIFAGIDAHHTHNVDQAISLDRIYKPRLIIINPNNTADPEQQSISQLHISDRYQLTPIIALASLVFPGQKSLCLQAGAVEFIAYPITTEKLISLIDSTLEAT